MKKAFLGIALVLSILVTGCEKEKFNNVNSDDKGEYSLKSPSNQEQDDSKEPIRENGN